MLIDATHAEETRVVVVDGNKVEEFDFESENKRQLAGNIYLAKVTRVEPSLQAAFVDYGGNRHGFLAFSEIHPDYYQIPVADREALMEEERAYADAMRARDDDEDRKPSKSRSKSSKSRSRSSKSSTQAADVKSKDAVETKEVITEISGMETIDLSEPEDIVQAEVPEGSSPMETVKDTPVEEPIEADAPVVETDVAEGAEDAVTEAVEAAGDDVVEEPADDSADAIPADDASEDDAVAAKADNGETDADADAEETDDDSGDEDVGDDQAKRSDAASKDSSIESVADDDDQEDIRPPRKPRPRRYKIQEVIKVRQILLVQVVKEERGNKGAALTTYLSLAGRYCVLMPNTARGGGISRKITNAADRKKLKEIAGEIEVPQGAGLIIRTAGAKRTKTEVKRDYDYLKRLWEQIRELTLKSIAPAKIYEEGDLIKRSIRDLYSREIDEVLVEGERGYRIAKDFMKMIMPSHAKNVKKYEEQMPLFARYQVESYLGAMFNPTVQLKSGGYIVIGVTEALVAIDVNSGRATKEGSIEDTATKTNLEAAEEVARQLRLRDLAGLIVIDFIDMDERKNNAAVEKRMKDKLKTDRARIQVGRISGFGLMEMSRQRLRPGMIEATTQPCPSCHGTGLIRSDDNMALSILRQIEEEGVRGRSREVLVRCPVSIANFLMNQKREHIANIESRYGLSVRIEGDVHLVSPDFTIEKFKTATRAVPEVTTPVVSVDTSIMEQVDAEEEEQVVVEEAEEAEAASTEEAKPKRKRRRRRRKPKSSTSPQNGDGEAAGSATTDGDASTDAEAADAVTDAVEVVSDASDTSVIEPPAEPAEIAVEVADVPVEEPAELAIEEVATAEAAAEPTEAQSDVTPVEPVAPVTQEAVEVEPVEAEPQPAEAEAAPEPAAEPELVATAAEPVAEIAVTVTEPVAPSEPPKPKRRGWWSLGG